MTVKTLICDGCKRDKATLLLTSVPVMGGVNIRIVTAESCDNAEEFDLHICGKECLMRTLNQITDGCFNPNPPRLCEAPLQGVDSKILMEEAA